ncbi:MAG: hypothetical protein IT534_10300 [Bauldia sp.]|nr:hypothetical protein [Bauldia sp.]
MTQRTRLGALLGGAALAVAFGAPAHAIEFTDLGLTRPDGVAGLMFDDRLCFPPDWLAAAAIPMIGERTPADLWLDPLIYFGTYVEAREAMPTPEFAAQILAQTTADAAGVARTQVEYGRRGSDGFLWFLQCLAGTDNAVFQAYLATADATLGNIATLIVELRTAEGPRLAEIGAALGAAGPAALPALRGLLAEPEMLTPAREGAAVTALGLLSSLGPSAATAANEVVLYLGVTTDPVRAAAREALVRMGPDAVDLVLDQSVALDSFIRLDAVLVLGAIDPPPLYARPTLDGLARLDPDDAVKAAAAAAIARIDAARAN